jgi:hypothetical protein
MSREGDEAITKQNQDHANQKALQEEQIEERKKERCLNFYHEYTKVLRTWFVAYGVGGAVLLLTDSKLRDMVSRNGWAKLLLISFFIGVFAQILIAYINKYMNWSTYYGYVDPTYKESREYKIARWLTNSIWIDKWIDRVTLYSFTLSAFFTFASLYPDSHVAIFMESFLPCIVILLFIIEICWFSYINKNNFIKIN